MEQTNTNDKNVVKSVATQVIGGKEYKVNSVYVGTQQLCTVLQRIAEKKALEEMGLK